MSIGKSAWGSKYRFLPSLHHCTSWKGCLDFLPAFLYMCSVIPCALAPALRTLLKVQCVSYLSLHHKLPPNLMT